MRGVAQHPPPHGIIHLCSGTHSTTYHSICGRVCASCARKGTMQQIKDPRRIGGVYLSGYWREAYTVLDIRTVFGVTHIFEVQWHDGRVTVHSTYWEKNDRIVYQPEVAA